MYDDMSDGRMMVKHVRVRQCTQGQVTGRISGSAGNTPKFWKSGKPSFAEVVKGGKVKVKESVRRAYSGATKSQYSNWKAAAFLKAATQVGQKKQKPVRRKAPSYAQTMKHEVNEGMLEHPVKLKKGPLIDSAATVGVWTESDAK